jgi:fucose permease
MSTSNVAAGPTRRSLYLVVLVFVNFFVMSLLTNILGPIIPDIIRSFSISLTAAAFLPFCFFIAYAVMSIPSGMLLEAYGEKRVIVAAFVMALAGALSFALFPHYNVAVVSLFVIGSGMAMLQVAINPLLRVAGGEENFAFNSALAQLIFGSASFLSPYLYSYLVQNVGAERAANPAVALLTRLVPAGLPWVSLYWVFALVAAAMVVSLACARLPGVQLSSEEQVGTWKAHCLLLKKPVVLLYFGTAFAYVGSEQGTANWISQFLATYHHVDPQTTGAFAVSAFWGLLTLGCLLGLVLLKVFDSGRVLIGFAAAALVTLTVALYGPAKWSVVAFPLMGLCASIMWPVIVSLALNSVAEMHGSFSGILCTGIAGGAVVPLIIGQLGDHFGLRVGMAFLYLTFGWVLSVGFWARPIIRNQTMRSAREG